MSVTSLQVAARKKHLGQYFTHQRVGRLLASLSGAEFIKTIIDPMVGAGDLLRSCLSVGARPEKLVGIELDPLALEQARAALKGASGSELILGDAFSSDLPPDQFGLVITNPPYIRYQSKGDVAGLSLPTGADIRAGLIRAIRSRPELSDDERELWLKAATSYPGTSDVAVPAWILSAALVQEGGVLAVVAPQAWLSRNYAHAVRELLDEAFDIEIIVEDGDAKWFNDAQVRTQLVVARRRPIKAPTAGHSIVRARATGRLETDGALKGALGSELAVARALREVTSSRPVAVTSGLTAYVEHGASVAVSEQESRVPARVLAVLEKTPAEVPTRTLGSYGWEAGQGLRSGANDFFYVSVADGDVKPAARWGERSLPIPSECLLPAVRRQSDLGDAPRVDASLLSSRVLDFQGWVTATDSRRMGTGDARVLPASVDRWITRVAATPFSAKDPTKLFPNLAAVSTNSRTDRAGRPVRFWYQLPELTARHRPTLFVGRVCGGRPKTYLNQHGVVVDANFSGLWPKGSDAMPAEALLALLSSSWVWANLEATCTVLGGGALKVEATDLRRVPLPDLSGQEVDRLTNLGREAMRALTVDLQLAINDVVAGAVAPGQQGSARAQGIQSFGEQSLRHRSRERRPELVDEPDAPATRIIPRESWN